MFLKFENLNKNDLKNLYNKTFKIFSLFFLFLLFGFIFCNLKELAVSLFLMRLLFNTFNAFMYQYFQCW